MKKLIYILLGIIVLGATVVYAAPAYTFTRTLIPELDNTYDLGTSTAKYRNLYINGLNFNSASPFTIAAFNGSGSLISTSSPTVGYIVATTTTATSTFEGGLNVNGGCLAVAGECLTNTTNIWRVQQDFRNDPIYLRRDGNLAADEFKIFTFGAGVGAGPLAFHWNAAGQWLHFEDIGGNTQTIQANITNADNIDTTALSVTGTGTSTFTGGIQTAALNVTGSATSTFAQGINLTTGCFAVNGTCVTGGGASLSGGSPNTLTYWTSPTAVSATSSPTVGYIVGTTTATSSFAGGFLAGSLGTGFHVLKDGNIGLGTDSPSSVAARYIHIYNTTSAGYSFQNSVRQWSFFVQGTTGNYGLYNHSVPGYGLMLDGSNNMGVGTTTAGTFTAKLNVLAGGNGTGYTFMTTNASNVPTFNIQDNGKVGIGTTSPWGLLSVASSTYNTGLEKYPIFSIATSSDNFGQILNVFATTSVANASSTFSLGYVENGARVVIGKIYGFIKDQLHVNGRISSSWRNEACDRFVPIVQISVDANSAVCNFGFDEGSTATVSAFNDLEGGGAMLELNSAAANNDYARIGVSDGFSSDFVASTTPIIDFVGYVGSTTIASTSAFIVGFPDTITTAAPINGCFFMATTSQTWWAMCVKGGTATTSVNTGISTSSVARLRLEITTGGAKFYGSSNVTSGLNLITNIAIPTGIRARGSVTLYRFAGGSNTAPRLIFKSIRVHELMPWYVVN